MTSGFPEHRLVRKSIISELMIFYPTFCLLYTHIHGERPICVRSSPIGLNNDPHRTYCPCVPATHRPIVCTVYVSVYRDQCAVYRLYHGLCIITWSCTELLSLGKGMFRSPVLTAGRRRISCCRNFRVYLFTK